MHKILLIVSLIALSGCSTIESMIGNSVIPPAPQTLNQKIIAADESVAALIGTATALETGGVIKPGSTVEAVVNATIITVQQSLDKASDDAAVGQTSEAQLLLAAATGAISGLQSALSGATSPTTGTATPSVQ